MKDNWEFRGTTYETCPHCMGTSEILVDAVSSCGFCGEAILPCSACEKGFANKCDFDFVESSCSRFLKED